LNDASWRALHTAWQERFARSQDLRERWQSLIQLKMKAR
jgi:hypothetical protein